MNVQQVSIISNRTDERLEQGYIKPPLFTVEFADSVNVLIDGKDSINVGDDPFNFTVDLRTNLYRARFIKVSKCIIPKINNITPFNNQLQIKHDLGTTAVFSLQPAFYNTTTMANELTSKINAQFVIDGIADTVTTAYDPITKTFSISSVGGDNFFIVDSCSFYTNGKYCCALPAEPLASAPSASTIYGSMAGLIYTRYLTVHSAQLNYYSFGDSLTSDSQQGGDIIAILNCCSIYTPQDYDISFQFAGNYSVIDTPDSPQINIVNSQKNLHSIIDIQVKDEYGNSAQEMMNIGAPYPENTLGITIFLDISF
jgi:hypothetical protein